MPKKKGKLIVFSAPSGSGKTTIVRHLIAQKNLNLEFSISATSRKKRGTEKHGKDYYFISDAAFKKAIEKNAFIEYEEVYTNNYYGTLKEEVKRIWEKGKHVIFDIDVVGGMHIKEQFPDQTLAVFVQPPSIEEMERRLRDRKTDTEEKIIERVAKAEKEMKYAKAFDVVLVNDNLDDAKKEAELLLHSFLNK